jgi:hypothetical protein
MQFKNQETEWSSCSSWPVSPPSVNGIREVTTVTAPPDGWMVEGHCLNNRNEEMETTDMG